MQAHLLVLGPNQVVDNVGTARTSASVTKPLAA